MDINFDKQLGNPKPTQPDYLAWNRNPTKPTVKLDPSWMKPNKYWQNAPRLDREQWIAGLANQHGWTRGAELGVWKGRTFLFVLDNCPQLTLIGVDLWAPQPDNDGPETWDDWQHEEFETNVRKQAEQFGNRAIIIKGWTVEAAAQFEDESLDFVFIDADHSSEGVRNDIIAWSPKVKPTGWIIGHDINWPTVRSVVEELVPGYIVGPDNAWARPKTDLGK